MQPSAEPEPPIATTTTVTDADNGKEVRLPPGATLVVQLAENPTTGSSSHFLLSPDNPVFSLSGDTYTRPAGGGAGGRVGGAGLHEFRFTIGQSANLGGWLRFLSLRPWEPGIADGELWESNVTIG